MAEPRRRSRFLNQTGVQVGEATCRLAGRLGWWTRASLSGERQWVRPPAQVARTGVTADHEPRDRPCSPGTARLLGLEAWNMLCPHEEGRNMRRKWGAGRAVRD